MLHDIVDLVNIINERTDAHATITISKHCPLSIHAYYTTPENEEQFMTNEYYIDKSYYDELDDEDFQNVLNELTDLYERKLKEEQ